MQCNLPVTQLKQIAVSGCLLAVLLATATSCSCILSVLHTPIKSGRSAEGKQKPEGRGVQSSPRSHATPVGALVTLRLFDADAPRH